MSLNPIETTKSISDRYISYLSTSFYLKNPELQSQFRKELNQDKFIKGPILEATPPFETGKTIEDLINEGLLSALFRELKCEEFPLNRPLYKHQENAILKLDQEMHNVVVATGTGSGKTEVFIIRILNYLFGQTENKELNPGVRALLLYPMNALVNDQLARMRTLLKNYPDITFGRYTGETEEKQKNAEEKYRKIYQKDPLPNELISREKMRVTPPHILLTNYAMLEFLLLRPNDNVFFDGKDAKNWKFMVIDEAHTYNGAKGIEMAMLLRRLKDRVVKSEPSRIQCIATSATLGGGIQDAQDVSRYAEELFGEHFDSNDVIQAVRKKVIYSDIEKAENNEIWGKVSPTIYEDWQKILNDETQTGNTILALIESGKKNGIPEHVLEESRLEAANDHIKFLYNILRFNEKIASVRAELEKESEKELPTIDNISKKVFPGVLDPRKTLVALIDLAVKAKSSKDDAPLIPARYHLFVRAIEGAYLSLYPEMKIFLERQEQFEGYPVFEIAACRQCGATYLVGETAKEGNKSIFRQPGKQYFDDVNLTLLH